MNIQMRLLFCTVLLVSLFPRAVHAAVRITEIAWMGIAGSNGQYGEWLELHNDGAESVDLSGWTLRAGGETMYTLSQQIAADSYLIVERTTASVPDPVPEVSGEAGPFAGGGLSNAGEDLILQDSDGNAVQILRYASGWPAGDTTTKETMQWNGSGWITAAPTPGLGLGGSESQGEDAAQATGPGESTVAIHSTSKGQPKQNTPHIDLPLPKILTAHVPYRFSAAVYTLEDKNPRGLYRWNFGDGTMIEEERHIAPIAHQYQYPGTYTLWVGFYRTVFSDDPDLYVQTVVTVTAPDLVVGVKDQALIIENGSATALDVSNWVVECGMYRAVLPKMTIIAPHARIAIPQATLNIPIQDTVILRTPDGVMVLTNREEVLGAETAAAEEPSTELKQEDTASIEATNAVDGTVVYAPSELPTPAPIAPSQTIETTPQKANRSAKHIVLGAAAFVVLALLLLLERLTAKGE